MVENLLSLGGVARFIEDKVRKTHDAGVQARGIAEHVHGCKLVEKLLPLCAEHGLCIELFDGEDYTPINSIEDMAKHMSACDIEWLCLSDGEVERTRDDDTTFVSIVLVYGNCADDPEIGRGEMVADWGGVKEWFDIFDPVIDDFVNDYYNRMREAWNNTDLPESPDYAEPSTDDTGGGRY